MEDTSTGSDDLTAGLMASIAPPVVIPGAAPEVVPLGTPEPIVEAPKGAVKPEEKPKPIDKPEKPAEKPIEKPALKKPDAKEINPDDPKVPAAELRAAYKASKAREKVLESELSINTSKIKELESRKVWGKAEDERLESLTKEREEIKSKATQLEASLHARDYSKSPEYKERFIDAAQRIYTKGLQYATGMNVKMVDKETGEEKIRPATEKDFQRVINSPLGERYRVAKELFGEDAHVVTKFADQIQDLDEQAQAAVTEKSKSFESEQAKKSELTTKQQRDFQSRQKQSEQAFEESYPDIFKDDTDPESKAALERGMSFVEQSINGKDLPWEEQATRSGLMKNMAAAFPVVLHRYNKIKEQVETLTAELEKLRGSDPGAGGDGGGSHKPEDDGGTDSLAADIAKMEGR